MNNAHTLIINENGDPREFILMIGLNLELREQRVTAIYPSLDYAFILLGRNPIKFEYVVVENLKMQTGMKINMLNQLAMNLVEMQIISVGFRYTRGDMPNLHYVRNLQEAANFIINTKT